jgi:hypothetical protein
MAVNHKKNQFLTEIFPISFLIPASIHFPGGMDELHDGQGPEIKWPLALPGNSGTPILLYQFSLGNQRSLLLKNRDVAENVHLPTQQLWVQNCGEDYHL